MGAYIPQCDENGNFTSLQCHGSTGMCWCVDTKTGKPLTTPVMAEQPDCDSILHEDDKCKVCYERWYYCSCCCCCVIVVIVVVVIGPFVFIGYTV